MPIWLIQIVVGIVLSVASTLLEQAFGPKSTPTPASGYSASLQTGGGSAQYFIIGTWGTAGKLEYANSWGNEGDTPNAYLTYVISLGDLPITALTGAFENGEAITTGTGTYATQGYPIPERADGSDDRFWIEFFNGSQTTANSYLTATFGSDPTIPWLSDMIGRGIPYVTTTAMFDRTVWNNTPQCVFSAQGIPLYDPRQDTTAGGSGSQRLDDQSTWAFTDNIAVMIYNILVGIRYENVILWGGHVAQSQLPYASWSTAMDVCDADISLAAGGSEKQFRGGRSVNFSDKPADIISDFLVACNGRIAECAGIYTVLIGAPQDAAATFTDADTIVTEDATLDPFPNLDSLVNGSTATYTEPTQAWTTKETTPYAPADFLAADRGQVLTASIDLTNTVFSGTQAQRIEAAAVNEGRRFLKHVVPLRPVWGNYRPLETLAWNSAENEYSGKGFLLTAWTEEDNGNVIYGLQEIDPSDHDWSTSDEGALTFAPLIPLKPAAQVIASFAVTAATFNDASGAARRPGIAATWGSGQVDVRAVLVTARVKATADVEWSGEIDYATFSGGGVLPHAFLAQETYQVQGVYVPFSARPMIASDWLDVTTDDIRLTAADFDDSLQTELATLTTWIGTGDLPTEIAANATAIATEAATRVSAISTEATARAAADTTEATTRLTTDAAQSLDVRDLYKTILDQGTQLGDVILGQKLAQQSVLQSLAVTAAGQQAQWTSDIQVAVGPTSAIAQSVTDLSASTAALNSTLNANIQSVQTVLTNAINTQAAATNSLLVQVTGGYTGSDPTLLTSGLVYTEQQARIANDNSLSTAISLLAAGTGLQFDWKVGYTFDSDIQSWGGNGTPTWDTGGYLRPANQASGPYVVSPTGLGVVAATYAQVEARLKRVGSPTWSGLAWYKRTTDSTWDSSRQSTQTEPIWDVNGFAVVTWGMTWDSTIDQIRLDLSTAQTGTDYFDIDWVYIGRPSPSASQAQVGDVQTALTSSILAEASDRQALSTLVTGAADPTGLTLSTVSSGMIYDEKTARTTADSSLNTLITGVQSEIDAANTNISGLSAAQSTLSSSVTTLSGTVSSNSTAITALQTSVNDPTTGLSAINTVVDTLSSEISTGGGSAAAQQNAQAVRTLELIANDLAVQLADGILSAKGQQLSLAGTIASVSQQLTGQISQVSGNVDLVNSAVTQIQQTLPGLASLGITQSLQAQTTLNSNSITTLGSAITSINSTITTLATSAALTALTSTVTANSGGISTLNTEVASLTSTVNNPTTGVTALNTAVSTLSGSVTSQGAAITSANAAITALQSTVNNGTTGVAATATALSSLSTTVTGQGSTQTAQATSIQSLNAALGGSTSLINVKMQTLTGPTGYSRYGIVAAVNDSLYRSASFFLDAPTDHTLPTVIGFQAGKVVWYTAGGTPFAAMNSDGTQTSTNGAVYIDWIGGGFRLQAA